jgi:lipopolysaccharide export system permease protein
MWPYFLGALIITLLNMSLSLWVIPQAQREIIRFESQYIKSSQRVLYDENAYRQIAPGTFAYVRGYSPRAENVSFFAIEEYDDSKLVAKLEASSASFEEESGRWTAPRYVTYRRTEAGIYDFELHRNLDTLINLDARELGETKSLVKTMTISELSDYIDQQRQKSSDDVYIIEVERHTRYSYPIATFILTLIGVSLSSRKVRGGMGVHIGLGITLCFSYIMLGRIFEQIAISGSIMPGLGVWLPNIVFALIAAYVYIKAPK